MGSGRLGAGLLAVVVVLVVASAAVVVAHGAEGHAAPASASPSPSPVASSSAASSPGASTSASPVAMPGMTHGAPMASLPPGTLEATGIVLRVDSPAFGRVSSFVLLTPGGEELTLDVSGMPFDAAFPVTHIVEHQMTSQPVEVHYAIDGDRLVVLALADAE